MFKVNNKESSLLTFLDFEELNACQAKVWHPFYK